MYYTYCVENMKELHKFQYFIVFLNLLILFCICYQKYHWVIEEVNYENIKSGSIKNI